MDDRETKDSSALSSAIEEKVGEVRLDALDMSFGEILGLHKNKELVIAPEYQRLFRWSFEQRSRLIESILLGLPIPQFFVIENEDGTFELIDGLQRISSVIHFLQPEDLPVDQTVEPEDLDENDSDSDEPLTMEPGTQRKPLRLEGCDIVTELNGLTADDLPLAFRLKIKRSAIRMTIIKKQSKSMLRYQMFKRLNTGGSMLSGQEIRNATARIIGPRGIAFYEFMLKCAGIEDFRTCTATLTKRDKSRKQDEELVLRFFALKNARGLFKGSVSEFLTAYMEKVTISDDQAAFDYSAEEDIFRAVFRFYARLLGAYAFVRFRGDKPFGSLAPTFFEGFTMGAMPFLKRLDKMDDERIKSALIGVRQTKAFLDNIGPGANNQQKLAGRIDSVTEAITAASE